jgi:hypothetical protein
MPLPRNGLDALLLPGQEARMQALATYLAALPVATHNHWEFLRCILYDLAALRACITALRAPPQRASQGP